MLKTTNIPAPVPVRKSTGQLAQGATPKKPLIETNDGTRLFYQDWGIGQPVVFIHGWDWVQRCGNTK